MSQIFCHDCQKMLPPGAPRIVTKILAYGDERLAYGDERLVYICGDCEYRRVMKGSK